MLELTYYVYYSYTFCTLLIRSKFMYANTKDWWISLNAGEYASKKAKENTKEV